MLYFFGATTTTIPKCEKTGPHMGFCFISRMTARLMHSILQTQNYSYTWLSVVGFEYGNVTLNITTVHISNWTYEIGWQQICMITYPAIFMIFIRTSFQYSTIWFGKMLLYVRKKTRIWFWYRGKISINLILWKEKNINFANSIPYIYQFRGLTLTRARLYSQILCFL